MAQRTAINTGVGSQNESLALANSVKSNAIIRRNKRRCNSNTNNRSPPASQRAQADHKTARQVSLDLSFIIYIFLSIEKKKMNIQNFDKNQKVVKMLVAVVILFAVCWSPYLIDNVLTSFAFLPTTRTGPMKHMKMAL
jgi:hypothetical protein